MSNTLTNEVKRRLAEFAAAITPPASTTPAAPAPALSVSELRARGITTDKKGKPLTEGVLYRASTPPAVNHARRLQTAYVAGGWPRVELYLQPFLTPAGFARQQQRAAGASAPESAGWALASGTNTAGDFGPLAEPAATTEAPVPPVVDLATSGTPGYENALYPGVLGETAGDFGALAPIDTDVVQDEVLLCEPPVREFTKLCLQWEREADAAAA